MERLFYPAIALSNRLKFSGKFLLLALLFAVQIGYVCWQNLSASLTQQTYARNELEGIKQLQQFMPLIEHTQQHRGLSFRQDNDEKQLESQLDSKRQQIEQLLVELNTASRDSDWQQIPKLWQNLLAASEAGEARFEQHNQLVQLQINELTDIASDAGLQLDPDPAIYYSVQTLIQGLPEFMETLAQLRGYSSGLAQGNFAPNSYLQLNVLTKRLLLAIEHLNKEFERAFSYNPLARQTLEKSLKTLKTDSQKLHDLIRQKLMGQDGIQISANALFQQASQVLNQSFELHRQLTSRLQADIQQRLDTERRHGYLVVGLTLLLGGLLCYFLCGIYLGIQHSIQRLNQAADQAANGDLRCTLTLDGRDELTTIGERFKLMLDSIQRLLLEARQTSEDVNDTSKDLIRIAEQSENYLQEQQLESTQVATAITQMASTVNEVAANAEEAARAAEEANQQAQHGQQVVKDSIHRIEQLAQQLDNASEVIAQLEKDSEAIGSVLDVIKGIAEQTNLLALNAAIEAARAGEQGRGFAVVADEVRTLASRTQKSTQEIRDMIERLQQGAERSVSAMAQGRNQAHQGVEKSSQAGVALEQITRSVLRIVDMNNQIASAAEEQSVVAEQINQNIVKITHSTSRTLAAGRQVTQASNALGQQATELLSSVGQFQLD